jgi:UDP-4-amino-4-deoxy-L-arabinose-oxoglutarate aminotransferase
MKRIEFFRHAVGDDEQRSVGETFESLFLTLGPRVAEFESRFAAYLGAEYAIGTSSCSMALILALRALGIGPGDEVITTPMTFIATSNAVLHVGATVVFAEVDPTTGLLEPEAVEAKVTSKTTAVIVVHLYGQMAPMPRFRALADRHGLALIEDAAHAIEATRDGVRVGELGDLATFSFYPTKSITSGDGGAVVTSDAALNSRIRQLRNHGVTADATDRHGDGYVHWDMIELGYKAAMTDIEAAILLPQLDHLDARRDQRAALAAHYSRALARCGDIQQVATGSTSAHHLLPVLVPRGHRDRILSELGRAGIGCAVNYRAVPTLSYYRQTLGFRAEDWPVAWDWGERQISLPLWPGLRSEDVDVVVSVLAGCV